MLRGFDREATVTLRLVGPGAVEQALAAAAVAWARELSVDDVVAGLESVDAVAGRLERLSLGTNADLDFDVWIDQAHNAADLRQVLGALRALGGAGQIHCVLGAEGLQNRAVRIGLAEAAEVLADRVILTTDNPRSEDPDQILDDLLAGFQRPGRVRLEPDRSAAIAAALADARPGDAVLIAGKGRAAYQILAERVVPFDDHATAASWLGTRHARWTRTSA